MSQLVKQERLGDITFGVPEDIELLNSPWGFYTFLGVSREASVEEIRRAYRKSAFELHPDRGGDEEHFKSLQRIIETLLDDDKELGPEHSQRRHYDEVSALDSYFDEFIEHKGERTRKLSEILLIQMQAKRKQAKVEHEKAQKFPEFAELKEELQRADSDEKKREISDKMQDISAKAAGLTPEMRKRVDEMIEQSIKDFDDEQRKFLRSFSHSPQTYFSKILDVFYVGDDTVEFGVSLRNLRFGFCAHEDKKEILELILAGDCYIAGFPQVHFKSKQAEVLITDPTIEGIFHVINGSVRLRYNTSSYGKVIRARAPNVEMIQGFEQKGELFVPQGSARQEWWNSKPALDITVREGTVSLELRSQDFAIKYGLFDVYRKYKENIIEKIYKKDY